MTREAPALVETIEDVRANIRRFERELRVDRRLIGRLGHVRAWYAERAPGGRWTFGPSQFVGYKNNTGKRYIETAKRKGPVHGGTTERTLSRWFDQIDRDTRLGRELFGALQIFLSGFGKSPSASARVNVLKPRFQPETATPRAPMADNMLDRISTDPRICGGRPCIKGTRMRVTDIVDMLAHGATRAEIVQDFDYLSEEDITAALSYAARAADHRVIRTA